MHAKPNRFPVDLLIWAGRAPFATSAIRDYLTRLVLRLELVPSPRGW